MIDIIFITNLPAFYKINLYNKIAETKNIYVIFTDSNSNQRNADFYTGNKQFKFTTIPEGSIVSRILFVRNMLNNNPYKQLVIGGWDQVIFWFVALISSPQKNGLVIESSIFESSVTGLKRVLKTFFLSRVSRVYVSGESQADLCLKLNFNGTIIKTRGVGLFNVISQPVYSAVDIVNNFIYVGRLSPEKNLKLLISVFNELPNLNLNIVGFGPQEQELKIMAKDNVKFYGAIPNSDLYKTYIENHVFILPSIVEPWGLVVEEALNAGLPVIVSDKVGCAKEIVDDSNGLVFPFSDSTSLKNCILKMLNVEYYNKLRFNVSKLNFSKSASEQVDCYLTSMDK